MANNLRHKDADTLSTVTWPGNAGHRYTFTLYSKDDALPAVAGVYILCKLGSNNYWNALYVGETLSFHERLVTNRAVHDGFQRADAHGFTHICLLGSANALQRRSIETELRQSLKPPCNDQPVPRAS